MARVEGLEGGQRVAADVGRDVHRPDLLLRQLERAEHRPLRAADAEARRPRRQRAQGLGHVGAALALPASQARGGRQVDVRQVRSTKAISPGA
jgi:hypothetical protein